MEWEIRKHSRILDCVLKWESGSINTERLEEGVWIRLCESIDLSTEWNRLAVEDGDSMEPASR